MPPGVQQCTLCTLENNKAGNFIDINSLEYTAMLVMYIIDRISITPALTAPILDQGSMPDRTHLWCQHSQ